MNERSNIIVRAWSVNNFRAKWQNGGRGGGGNSRSVNLSLEDRRLDRRARLIHGVVGCARGTIFSNVKLILHTGGGYYRRARARLHINFWHLIGLPRVRRLISVFPGDQLSLLRSSLFPNGLFSSLLNTFQFSLFNRFSLSLSLSLSLPSISTVQRWLIRNVDNSDFKQSFKQSFPVVGKDPPLPSSSSPSLIKLSDPRQATPWILNLQT